MRPGSASGTNTEREWQSGTGTTCGGEASLPHGTQVRYHGAGRSSGAEGEDAMPMPATCADVRDDVVRWAAISVAASFLLAITGQDARASLGTQWAFAETSLLLAVLFAAAFSDARTCEIPDAAPICMALLHALFSLAPIFAFPVGQVPGKVASDVAAGLLMGGGLLTFTLLFERATGMFGMGGGDIKLVGALGFACGLDAAVSILCVACGIFAARLLLGGMGARGWKGNELPVCEGAAGGDGGEGASMGEGHAAPFAPALALAALAVTLVL